MILHCKEFTVDDNLIIMGHDRGSRKRFFCVEIQDLYDIQRFIPEGAENSKFWDKIESIFWIKRGNK